MNYTSVSSHLSVKNPARLKASENSLVNFLFIHQLHFIYNFLFEHLNHLRGSYILIQ